MTLSGCFALADNTSSHQACAVSSFLQVMEHNLLHMASNNPTSNSVISTGEL